MQRIPKKFKLFASTINVVWDNKRMQDLNSYGCYEYSTQQITLSNKDGLTDTSEGKIVDTFYHEKVHAILSAMNEQDLNTNEKFVDVFAKLLRQSDETSEFE